METTPLMLQRRTGGAGPNSVVTRPQKPIVLLDDQGALLHA